jgi:hypothetical protein
MHVVQRRETPPAPPAAGVPSPYAGPGSDPTASAVNPPLPGPRRPSQDEQLQDLVLALLLRAGGAEIWPEPGDFPSTVHRAILQQLQAGPPWPDVATAVYRLHESLGDTVTETLERIQLLDEMHERLSPEMVYRELDVRRLELRKRCLLGQYDALTSGLHEEGGGQNSDEHRATNEQLSRLFGEINQTILEQQRLGVVGTASWSIRRGQEVLGG